MNRKDAVRENEPYILVEGPGWGKVEFFGKWLVASVEIDEPPRWLKRDTPASISYAPTWRREENGWTIIETGLLRERRRLEVGGYENFERILTAMQYELGYTTELSLLSQSRIRSPQPLVA